MQIESKNSVMALVKNVSDTGATALTISKQEYAWLVGLECT